MMNWTKNKLIDVAEIVMGQSPNSSFYNSENVGMPFLQGCAEFGKTYPNTQVSTSQIKKIGKQNSILFSVRAPVGKINWADTDYCIGRGLSAIRGTKVEQNYLYQYFLYLKERGGYSSQGSTFDSINFDELSKVEIQNPEEKPEQTHIAEILSTADAAITQTEALIAKYQCIKTGLMQDLLTRGIDTHGNIRSKATHKFVVKNGIEVPEEWEVISIEEFASKSKYAIVDGPFGSNLKIIHYRPSGVQVIQSGFVTDNKFIPKEYLFVDQAKLIQEIRSKVETGDIIMAKIGANCGTCAIMPDKHPASIIAGNCLKITVGSNNSNRYLEILLHYLYANGKLDNIKSTTAQPAISMAQLKIFKIPRPSKDEQLRIVTALGVLEKTIEETEAELSKLHSLKTGLMPDLLSGRVRVKIKD